MKNPVHPDYSKKWYAMSAVAMGVFVGTIDGSIVNIALPTLVKDFNTQFSVVQWVVLSYLLTVTTLMLGAGRLADIIGKKSLYIAGMLIFTIGSLLCALSPTISWLITARVFQGFGAVFMMALGAGIISEAFPPSERGKALGFIGSIVSIGIVTGPVLGGFIIYQFSWQWIFLVNLPIGILGIFMAVKFLPSTSPRGGQRFDIPGAILLFISLLALLLALTFGQERGFTDFYIPGLFACFLVFLGGFIITELKTKHPLLDIRLFRKGLLAFNFLMGLFTFITIAGVILLIPFYLENIIKLDHRSIGFLLAIISISSGLVSPLAGSLSDRYGSWIMNALGLAFILAGYILALRFNEHSSIPSYVASFVPLGIGLGVFMSPNNSAIMHSFPPDQFGVASSLLAITRTLGQISGIAALGALWSYRVSFYSGELLQDGPSTANAAFQVAGLQDVFIISAIIIFLALVLAVYGFFKSRRIRA
ncbi:MAG: MFS transporter [bacterium]|nr:MFS transporter [bacterium]